MVYVDRKLLQNSERSLIRGQLEPAFPQDAVLADGTGRHKLSWSGSKLGDHCTLEWRVFMMETALRTKPIPVSNNVILIQPPAKNHCLVVAVILGPAVPTTGFPRAKDRNAFLLAEGRLSDGRRVWITYCYTPPGEVALPAPSSPGPREFGSRREVLSALDEKGELSVCVPAPNSDGSLAFFDCRAVRKKWWRRALDWIRGAC
jgi:hypothetical protein